MRNSVIILFVLTFLIADFSFGNAAQRQGAAGPPGSPGEEEGKGKASSDLSELETKAQEAERSERWQDASYAYVFAAAAARTNGQYQKAISYGNKAFELGEKARSPSNQARAIRQLALIYSLIGQGAKVRELLEKGVEIVKQIPSGGEKDLIEANMYRDLGVDFLRTGETQKAIDYISYSLQVQDSQLSRSRRARSPNAQRIQTTQLHVVRTIELLGNAYRSVGNTEEALKAYEKALTMIKNSAMTTPAEGRLYRELGNLYLGQKDFARALENLQRGLALGEKIQDAGVIQRASSQIGDALRQTNKPSEAIPYYKKAIDTIESSRSLLESEEFRSSFFENKRATYSGIVLAHLGDNKVEEAFNYSERARSRAFLDILGSKVQLSHGGLLLEEERSLQGRISALQAKLAAGGDEEEQGRSDKGQLRRELEATQKAYGDFLSKVRKENKEQASLMNVEPLTLKEAQELLDPGVTMLEYFVAPDQLVLWVVERERVEFVRIPLRRRELVSKVSALRESVFQLGEREKFKTSAQELYKLLIQPALPHVRGKELLIIPHDVLHYLPFQALLSPQGKYLVQDYPIYYLSSASLMQFTKEKKRAGGERALVMGNPSLGDAAYNLRFAEREAKEVAGVYPKSEVYLKEQASKPRAISLGPNFEMLHFAVHAELNENDPVSSALLLVGDGKDDGRLKVGEIFSLNLKAGMVVLSACETGLGKLSNGDELIGLTRAFIYAGTPSVVTTLWKVNDRSSYELMREFYRHLKTGKKSEALRQAQLSTMKEFPEPFYWAAYQLTGEP